MGCVEVSHNSEVQEAKSLAEKLMKDHPHRPQPLYYSA